MAAPLRPNAAKAYTRDKIALLNAVASATLAPTVAEATGATTLDISLIAFLEASGMPSKNTNRVTLPQRFGDAAQYEQIGASTITGGTMLFAFDPQAAAGADGKKAWAKLQVGWSGFLLRRTGLSINTDFAAGQFGDVYPVEFDPGMPTTVGDNESALSAFACEYAVTGPPVFNVAILA